MATNYLLKLKGYVGGYDFDADYVDWKLEQNKGKAVDVLIDSLGGSVATALTIAHRFKDHGDVTVHYAGMNASAATIASMGAKKIMIDRYAMYLVHKASTQIIDIAALNADELEERIKSLEKEKANLMKIDLNIASMYADRCKKDRDSLLALMKEGGWLTAEEALEWGFVDEIEDNPAAKKPEKVNGELAASMEAAGIPLPKNARTSSLMERILSIFGTHNTQIMNKIFKNICDALQVEAIAISADGTASVTESQLQTIETAIAEKDATIAALTEQNTQLEANIADYEARIAELEKAPGETTAQVTGAVKDVNPNAVEDQLNDYRNRLREARDLLKSI